MINLNEQYPNKTAGVTANYPFGQARNVTLPGDRKGTPWDQALVNDLIGFQQAAMKSANMVPSGVPDNANISQVLEAIKTIVKSFSFGWGQDLSDKTSSIVLGTTYTNTTSRPISFYISIKDTTAEQYVTVNLEGKNIIDNISFDGGQTWGSFFFSFTVNPGKTYMINRVGSGVLKIWMSS